MNSEGLSFHYFVVFHALTYGNTCYSFVNTFILCPLFLMVWSS